MFQAISLAVIAVLVGIDQLTKYAAVSTVMVDGPKEFLFGLFQFRYVENTGAAFSSFSDNTMLLTVATVIILSGCLVLLMSKKLKPMFVNICLLLVVAGGIGNVIDRIMYGYVVDFIEPLFIDFAVFNFADCCITVGAFLLIGYEIYEIINERKKKAEKND
jgi:signal peptidase II